MRVRGDASRRLNRAMRPRVDFGLRRGRRQPLRATAMLALALVTGSLAVTVHVTQVAAASGFDTHQGIDHCGNYSNTIVTDLWDGTPFYDWGVYLGGAQANYSGCSSTTNFVSYLRNMGWGIMPLWDDLQAPQVCQGNVNQYMSMTPSVAYSQGQTSGHNALAAMSTFGFAAYDEVWLDVEWYNTSVPGCEAAVNAYINGWDSVVGATYQDAGVYASASDAIESWLSLTYVPNEIWVADHTQSVNTVWNEEHYVGNSYWVPDQRIHQYRGGKYYSLPWGCTGGGCTTSATVDVDCADAWIDGGTLTQDDETNETNESASLTGDAECNLPAQ